MTELVERDIKMAIITVFYMFKKLEEWLDILTWDTKVLKKDLNRTLTDENYNIWDNRVKGRSDTAEEKFSKFEYIAVETLKQIQSILAFIALCQK